MAVGSDAGPVPVAVAHTSWLPGARSSPGAVHVTEAGPSSGERGRRGRGHRGAVELDVEVVEGRRRDVRDDVRQVGGVGHREALGPAGRGHLLRGCPRCRPCTTSRSPPRTGRSWPRRPAWRAHRAKPPPVPEMPSERNTTLIVLPAAAWRPCAPLPGRPWKFVLPLPTERAVNCEMPPIATDEIAVETSGSAGAVTSCSPAAEEMSAAAPDSPKTARPDVDRGPVGDDEVVEPGHGGLLALEDRRAAARGDGAPETSMT